MTSLAFSTFLFPSSPRDFASLICLLDSMTRLITSCSLTLRSSSRSRKVLPSSFSELGTEWKENTIRTILRILELKCTIKKDGIVPDSCVCQCCRHSHLKLSKLVLEIVTHRLRIIRNLTQVKLYNCNLNPYHETKDAKYYKITVQLTWTTNIIE